VRIDPIEKEPATSGDVYGGATHFKEVLKALGIQLRMAWRAQPKGKVHQLVWMGGQLLRPVGRNEGWPVTSQFGS
jgi:hypothetical protein